MNLWISWETQRRNRELAEALKVDYCPILHSDSSRLRRYFLSIRDTIRRIKSSRPKIVFCQSPSVFLTITLAFLRNIFKFEYVVDLHNAGVEALTTLPQPLRFFYRRAIVCASATIVSNKGLKNEILPYQSRIFILPDKVPTLQPAANSLIIEHPAVTFISSFAKDEPLKEFLEAAEGIPATFYITGRREKAGGLIRYESERIRFTDFLDEKSYDSLISNSELLVDLTTRENCLVCGAYEALAAGTPGILSDSIASRKTFPQGFLFSKNSTEELRKTLTVALEKVAVLKDEMKLAREEFEKRWLEQFELLRDFLKM